jgi:hypothetical protein
VLRNLATNSTCRSDLVIEAGGVESIILSMRSHLFNDSDIQCVACEALYELASGSILRAQRILDWGGLAAVLDARNLYTCDEEVSMSSGRALSALECARVRISMLK